MDASGTINPQMFLKLMSMGVATGVAALTLTRARPLRGIRNWIKARSNWWGELVTCPYCMSHWVAAGMVLGSWPGSWRWAVVEWLLLVAVAMPAAALTFGCALQVAVPEPQEKPHETRKPATEYQTAA